MNRCVIIGGAAIEDYSRIRSYLRERDHCIYCDSGLRHGEGLRAKPHLIVGDFDSWEKPAAERQTTISEEAALSVHLDPKNGSEGKLSGMEDAEVIVLPPKKDDTDTVFAVREGLRRGYREFLMLGVTGQRLDHTLVNVYALLLMEEQGAHGMIVADDSEMEIVGPEPVRIPDSFSYFSLITICGDAREVTIKDALFPLEHGEIRSSYQYGCSNEVVPGRTASVSVGEGKLLLIRGW